MLLDTSPRLWGNSEKEPGGSRTNENDNPARSLRFLRIIRESCRRLGDKQKQFATLALRKVQALLEVSTEASQGRYKLRGVSRLNLKELARWCLSALLDALYVAAVVILLAFLAAAAILEPLR